MYQMTVTMYYRNILWTTHYHLHFIGISADGIALGAAATTAQTHVEMIVFVAIMLHKVKLYCLCNTEFLDRVPFINFDIV